MGGINSGRKRTANRGAVEHFPVIDLRILKRARLIRHGECSYDTLRWHNQDLNDLEVRVFVDLSDIDHATLRIGGDVPDQRAAIECAPCPFGGYRCYFLCPLTGTRCEQLFLVGGIFASRKAHRLTYATQSQDDLSRARRKVRKLHRRLDGTSRYPRLRGKSRQAAMCRLRAAEVAADTFLRERYRTMMGDVF